MLSNVLLFIVDQWFSILLSPRTTFSKTYPIDHFTILTPHEQLV